MVENREAAARKVGTALLELVERQRQKGISDPTIAVQYEGDRLLLVGTADGTIVEVRTAS